jgi:hypothetical protein
MAAQPGHGAVKLQALSVRRSTRWRGSGPAHWHNRPVRAYTARHIVAAPAPLATVRKRGMYGY